MSERTFPAVAALIQQAQQAAANEPNHLAGLVLAIRKVIESHPDAYALAGALVEGVAITIRTRIPEEKREETATAAVRLLYDRLHTEEDV